MGGHAPVAACGTKSAKARHRRRGESCEACAAVTRPMQPCGTRASYKRGCRCERCTTAHREDQRARAAAYRAAHNMGSVGGRKPAPCGTAQARRRHKRKNETCQACADTLKLQPCGTPAAYRRHQRANQTPCEPCTDAYRAAKEKQRRRQGIQPRNTLTTDELVHEIRFLLQCGEGEHRILQAIGYAGRWKTLRGRLVQAGYGDVADQVVLPWELVA